MPDDLIIRTAGVFLFGFGMSEICQRIIPGIFGLISGLCISIGLIIIIKFERRIKEYEMD